ncbi:hypothetical protein TNCV_2059371 [Trichonephila clavipes]|uniref:RING-type domain-containing protein n=1 Tax=Trichonephila clavipes TaxID=2585209 RepID=A0A8X6UPF6_TRICX|nr:hypothetical protein TNCV_2059371 [Trichonephila clavipes]
MFCAICKDRLNSVVEVVSTECGHVFHSECLFKRIEDSKTCPECQKPISRENITKLYINIDPNDEFDAAFVESNIRSLNRSLMEKEAELNISLDHLKELQLQAANEEKKADMNRQRQLYLQYELLCVNREYAALTALEKEVKKLKRENKRLIGKIALNHNICPRYVEEDLHAIHSNITANIGNTELVPRRSLFKKKALSCTEMIRPKDKRGFKPSAK